MLSRLRVLPVLCVPLLFSLPLSAAPELVLIGNPGNLPSEAPFDNHAYTPLRGSVGYPFRIAKAEVGNADYAGFLNAVARTDDPHGLFDPRMKITRSGAPGAWSYASYPGSEYEGVAFVSRVNAARYCNFLTTGDLARGPYRVEPRARENGEVRDAIVGDRDFTFVDAPRLYALPTSDEFLKAGWHDGSNAWKQLTAESRHEPSHYGVTHHASGLREWMEEKYRRGATFALGAADSDTGDNTLNAGASFQLAEFTGNEKTGFRVVATAPLHIGNRLNPDNNFFWRNESTASLRVHLDGPARTETFRLSLRNFARNEVWSRDDSVALKPGLNTLPFPLPRQDGYYELVVKPGDPTFGDQGVVLPLAVMNTPMPDQAGSGHFGFTIHITRTEKRFTFEEFDLDLLRRLGVSQVRVDVHYHDTDGNQTVLRRLRAVGLNPLAVITRDGLRQPGDLVRLQSENPALVKKWAAHGIPAEFAWHAEHVWTLVNANKDVVHDWEYVNEPTFIHISAEDYTQALKAAYTAAKIADPACNFMAGDLNTIHAPVLRNNGGAFFDSVSTHIYGFYLPSFWGIAGKMRELNGWLAATNVPQKPRWITEIAACTYNSRHLIPVRTSDENTRYQGLHQAKLMAAGLAFGASKVLPYTYRDVPVENREGLFGAVDRNGLPKPAIMSFRTAALLLGKAKFVGFMKDHSFESGKVVGLHFRDPDNTDVLVLWRNDLYSRGRFDVPFDDIILPPESVAIRSTAADAELFDMTGAVSSIKAGAGKTLSVPVSEYPVFVRGKLAIEPAAVATAHNVPAFEVPRVAVKILGSDPERACDQMTGVALRHPEKTRASVTVRVYNNSAAAVSGTVRLQPASGWREWPWKISPHATVVTIPAHGMATATFEVPVPARTNGDRPHLLHATFADGQGAEFRDTVTLHATGLSIIASDWRTYARGFKLAATPGNAAVRITWDADHARYVSFYRATAVPFADDEAGLKKPVGLTFDVNQANVHAVSILFRDRDNEVFQLKRPVKMRPGGKDTVTVQFNPTALLEPGVIVHTGGNGRVDFPVRLQGFNFDLKTDGPGGSILVKPIEIQPRSTDSDGTDDALGGVEDGV